MNDLVKVIEEYKIFNYLVPGVLATYLLGDGSFFAKVQALNLFVAFFIYYFVGFVLSRVGSLVVKPILEKTGFVRFAGYDDFIAAEIKDKKITTLSQENNTYRTYIAVLATIIAVNAADKISGAPAVGTRESSSFLLILAALLVLMLFSYKKQTSFITRRVNLSHKKSDA